MQRVDFGAGKPLSDQQKFPVSADFIERALEAATPTGIRLNDGIILRGSE